MHTKKPLYPKKNSPGPPADLAPKIFFSGRLNPFHSGKQPHVGCRDRVRECHCFLGGKCMFQEPRWERGTTNKGDAVQVYGGSIKAMQKSKHVSSFWETASCRVILDGFPGGSKQACFGLKISELFLLFKGTPHCSKK